MLRRDTHDRPDVWYVLEDGSNLNEVARDLLDVALTVGLPFLDAVHDPAEAIAIIRSGGFGLNPDSPLARDLIHRALRPIESAGSSVT